MMIKIKASSLCIEGTGQKLSNKGLKLSSFSFIVSVFYSILSICLKKILHYQ